MPGFILTQGSPVICAHGGQAVPSSVSRRVLATGEPVMTLSDLYLVTGCPLPPTPAPGPCISGHFITAASRVLVGGQPVVVQGAIAICTPTGTPLQVLTTQQRVIA